MRQTRPDLPRPFRKPQVPVVPVPGVLFNAGLMLGLDVFIWKAFSSGWRTGFSSASSTATSVVIYKRLHLVS